MGCLCSVPAAEAALSPPIGSPPVATAQQAAAQRRLEHLVGAAALPPPSPLGAGKLRPPEKLSQAAIEAGKSPAIRGILKKSTLSKSGAPPSSSIQLTAGTAAAAGRRTGSGGARAGEGATVRSARGSSYQTLSDADSTASGAGAPSSSSPSSGVPQRGAVSERRVGLAHSFKAHGDSVFALATWGDLLASGGGDSKIMLWGKEAGPGGRVLVGAAPVKVQVLEGHADWVNTLVTWGELLVSGSDDCTVRL